MKNIFRNSGLILLIILIHSCKEKPTPPIVSTTVVTEISYTTGTSGGDVTNDGGEIVLARGICWNTSAEPTIANSKTTESGELGAFISNMTQLTPNTLYYVRAYATNITGTGYGNQVSFKTIQVTIPVLTTTAVSSITKTSASSGGNISADNGGSISARGVCWNTSTNPTTSNSKTTDGTGTGTFTSSLTGLVENTTYYVRAYATNSAGTEYGNQVSFTTITIPSVSTATVTIFTSTTATVGGNVTSDGNTTVTERGVYYGTSPNSQTTGTKLQILSGTGSFTSSITGLTPVTTYYLRAYAINSAGTSFGTEVSFTTTALVIGDAYQGGRIAYILLPSDPGYIVGQTHGLIAAPSDQSTFIQWYNGTFIATGATATAIGTGNANTIAIVAAQGDGVYAAKLCYDLVLGGYSDWYLPSKDELDKLYINRVAIGGFSTYYYWSSSEVDSNYSWNHYFLYGIQGYYYTYGKINGFYVRAVRSF